MVDIYVGYVPVTFFYGDGDGDAVAVAVSWRYSKTGWFSVGHILV